LIALASRCSNKSDSPTPPTSPTPPPASTTPIAYTAIGASDALGIGGSRPCVPLVPCPEGTGYVPAIVRHLMSGRTVTVLNLGLPGAVLGPETQALARRYGRDIVANFIEQEAPFVTRDATLITIFAGANDANAVAAAVEAGAGSNNVSGFIEEQVRLFGDDMNRLLRLVRDRAPSGRIVVANLPNLALLPYASGYGASRRQLLRQLSVGYSVQGVNGLVNQAVVVVDLLCDARSYDRNNYSSDGFHPNDRGYAFMTDVFVAAINAAGAPPPRVSCPEAIQF
jgi:lysophospholipase L1-like esterase